MRSQWSRTIFRMRFNSLAEKPLLYANTTGSSQNLQTARSRRTWTCLGSLQSKLEKKNRYGPGIPGTVGKADTSNCWRRNQVVCALGSFGQVRCDLLLWIDPSALDLTWSGA